MGLTGGGLGGLKQLRRRLEIMRGPQTRAGLAKAMGAAALKELQDGFRKSQDPYGNAWKPLARNRARNAKKGGSSKPLLDTGRLRRSFVVNPSSSGFTIWTKTKYAPFHQYGTGGRAKESVRLQPVSKRGRFVKRSKVGKMPKKAGATRVRALTFAAGSGKIPARMMVPSRSGGLGLWRAPMQGAANRFFLRILKRVI